MNKILDEKMISQILGFVSFQLFMNREGGPLTQVLIIKGPSTWNTNWHLSVSETAVKIYFFKLDKGISQSDESE